MTHFFNNILDELNEGYQYEFTETDTSGLFERYDLQNEEYSDKLYTQNEIADFYIYEYQNKCSYESEKSEAYKFFKAVIQELNEVKSA